MMRLVTHIVVPLSIVGAAPEIEFPSGLPTPSGGGRVSASNAHSIAKGQTKCCQGVRTELQSEEHHHHVKSLRDQHPKSFC